MKTKSLSCCFLLAAYLAGCATDTTQIQANYVSPYEYDHYTCKRLRGEAARITHRARETGARIDETAADDAARAIVGSFLPWAWIMLEGNDPDDTRQYAELKGHMNAIQEASIRKGCDIEFKPLEEGEMHRFAAAVQRFRRAAERGDTEAQITLGSLYMEGEGVPKDEAEAVRWYRMAAEQGNATAQFFLGVMYVNGDGVPQDATEAVRWYPMAAEQGNANAQFNLGSMYEHGSGVGRDFIRAHKWYNLAASRFQASEQDNRDQALRSRDRVASSLTSTDLAKAQRLAREWRPR